MPELDIIREALRDRKITAVSKATGISRSTITAIRDGRSTEPKYSVVSALAKYLCM